MSDFLIYRQQIIRKFQEEDTAHGSNKKSNLQCQEITFIWNVLDPDGEKLKNINERY